VKLNQTWAQRYKTFCGRNLQIFVLSQSVGPWQAIPAWSPACGYAGAYARVEQLKCAPGLSHIGLGWKGLPGTLKPIPKIHKLRP
jgi:hypothetical protein